jgi:hypothetical protein
MFRPPTNLLGKATLSNGQELLGDEIVAEQAASLGHHGRKAEKALAALRAWDAGEAASDATTRDALVTRAARDVWAFLVQRELCGLRDERRVIREMQIPRDVLNRLGAS